MTSHFWLYKQVGETTVVGGEMSYPRGTDPRNIEIDQLRAEITRLQDEVLTTQTRYEQLEIHNIKLDAEVERLRAETIEECARAIDSAAIEADGDGWSACDYAGYIRSLVLANEEGK